MHSRACSLCAAALSGCSDIYFDRRETIAPWSGNAVQQNKVVQMVDPWPPYSANRNIAFNGEVMQRAQQRYRDGKVIPPVQRDDVGRRHAAACNARSRPTRSISAQKAAAPAQVHNARAVDLGRSAKLCKRCRSRKTQRSHEVVACA